MIDVQIVAWALMIITALVLLYTYAGYPLLMAWLQRRGVRYGPIRPIRPTLSSGADVALDTPPLTVIIAAHNAADHIERKLLSCLALDYPKENLLVLVVSDGSTDSTTTMVEAFARDNPQVRLIENTERRGKAACLNDAVSATNTDLLLFTDARQTIDLQAARFLVSHFVDPAVGAVSGALEIDPGSSDGVVASAGAYWRMEKKLRAAEADVHSSVGVTGAIYALRRQAFEPLPEETILDDVLIPMTAVMAGWRVLFDVRARAFDAASDSAEQEQRRKIRTLAGNFQLLALRPALLLPSANPIWWQFLSHKILRVLAPLAMALFFVASALVVSAGPFWLLLFVGQLVAYTITILPETQGAFSKTKPLRLIKILRGFVRLQWFAVLGFVWFLQNRQPQLWQTTQHDGNEQSSEPAPTDASQEGR